MLVSGGKRSSKPGANTPTICVPPGPPAGRHLTQDVGLAAETALPIIVRDDEYGGDGRRGTSGGARSGGGLRHAIRIDEAAAQDRGGAHHPEEVRADGGAAHQFRRAVLAGYYVAEGLYGGDVLEDVLGTVAQIEKIGIGKWEILDVALAHVGEREHEAVGILVREGAQENCVGHAENGGGRADAEGDRQDGSGSEDRALAQSAQRVNEVANEHASLPEFVSG